MMLSEKISAINNMLRGFGKNAVQKIEMKNKDGQVIGMIRYGYKPQYVFDAVNQIIGPENWRYELVKEEIFENQAVAEVKLFLNTDTDWICKGSHKGQMQIVKGNVGDAQKGAITDAIQKCFSLVSIGQDSYRGLLADVFSSSSQSPRPPAKPAQPPAQQQQAPQQPQQAVMPPQEQQATLPPAQPPVQPPVQTSFIPPVPPSSLPNLPMIDGITYQYHDGFVVAAGKVYEKKEMLKASGFKWNKDRKDWYKELTQQTH